MKRRPAAVLMLAIIVFAGAVYAAFQAPRPAPTPLSAYVPQGALLSIESPDFSALLMRWTNSAEQKRWLASDDYAGFSRSRLFGRLGDAQNEFAGTAGLAPDAQFLRQIAGGQSLFAWYDVGNLEFLYITRMAPGEAEKTTLYQMRDKFEERKAGEASFYIRTGQQDQNDQDQSQQLQSTRTVAFAVRGDYLLLATREDLIAGALDLMQHPADRNLSKEPWYAASVAEVDQRPGDLRMTLNLTRIVPTPYFRSYWVQQNITELKQYSSALSDLYLDQRSYREERVLLPAHDLNAPAASDLAPVLAYLPAEGGVYRAQASPSTAEVLDQLEDKLLTRNPSPYRDWRTAPEADLTLAAGDAISEEASEASLERFIDEVLPATRPRSAELQPLSDLLNSAKPSAMLVFSSARAADTQTGDPVFSPVHSAVVLAASESWDAGRLQRALTSALNPTLSIAGQGVGWVSQQNAQASWFELDGPGGLALAVRDRISILASDRSTLLRLVGAAQAAPRRTETATVIGGFRPAAEHPAFGRLTTLLDHPDKSSANRTGDTPRFFSGNMASLADTFTDLSSETFTESPSRTGNGVRQTVVYQWR